MARFSNSYVNASEQRWKSKAFDPDFRHILTALRPRATCLGSGFAPAWAKPVRISGGVAVWQHSGRVAPAKFPENALSCRSPGGADALRGQLRFALR
jgi:hypothetical protein